MSLAALALAAASAAPVDRDLDFAAYMYGKGEYYQAAGEYHRWLFEHSRAAPDRARYGLGMCYLRGGRDEDARAALAAVAPGSPLAGRARHGLAVALVRLGRPAEALAALAEAPAAPAEARGGAGAAASPDGAVRPEHRLPAALAAGRSGDWARAAALLAAAARPDLAARAREAAAFRPPSPWLAGALAVVPGAGHVYAGRPDEALATFTPPVGLGLAAWYYAGRGEAWPAALTGGAAAVFWAGNVFGAVDAARKAGAEAGERAARPIARAVEDALPRVD